MCPPGGNTAAKPQHGVDKTEQSRAVEGLAFGPGVLDPKPPASKQARDRSMHVATGEPRATRRLFFTLVLVYGTWDEPSCTVCHSPPESPMNIGAP